MKTAPEEVGDYVVAIDDRGNAIKAWKGDRYRNLVCKCQYRISMASDVEDAMRRAESLDEELRNL